jgi:hypothetical protein
MKALRFGICAAIGISVLCIAGVAGAQENLDQGKSAAQLFAANCAMCHKSPQGLAKAGGILGLDSFLREHYTASKESAGALAAYLKSMDTGPAPARAAKRGPKGDEKAKSDEKKKSGSKAGDEKATEKKPESAAEPKASESKSESKPAEAKPSDGRPADIVAPEPKSGETKSSPPAAGETKPAEGGKSGKSD